MEKAVLVGLTSPVLSADEQADDNTMDELELLLETAGGQCMARVLQQRKSPDPRTFIGGGKLKELAELCKNEEAELVVFDNELSPSQTRNLEKALNCRVIDRSVLILDIFADRARTHEGRLQVELAQCRYTLPRLTGFGTEMSRTGAALGGGIGTRGPGETQLETDRRHFRRHIHQLENELKQVRQVRERQRERRVKNEIPSVALIGYTNAGKSTLLSALTGSEAVACDRLFETLDPLTRQMHLPDGTPVLLTDTVGFIHKLPHHLIESFRATLEELTMADLLLHVIDYSHPEREKQTRVAEDIVKQIGAADKPLLRVYNKIDKAEGEPTGETMHDGIRGLAVSARTGTGIHELAEALGKALAGEKKLTVFCFPYEQSNLPELLYRDGQVQHADYREDTIEIRAVCDGKLRNKLKTYIVQ
jgi:GTP-binding protein HflX